jgi:hypothetical protein
MTISADARQSSIERPRLSRGEDLTTVAVSSWLILGLFLDGYAHNNRKPESFFTPWHGVFYSGFLVTAVWMWSRYRRHHGIPAGYGLGFVGVLLFAAGGVADMAWHLAFGIEVGLEALLSPSHLILFGSGLLILSSPLRAAWSDSAADDAASSLRTFLPPLLSTTLVAATVSFFLMEFSPFLTDVATGEPYRFVAMNVDPDIGPWLAEKLRLQGFASILIATLILLGPTLLLLRRWRPPPGSFTILFTTVAVLSSALHGFEMVETIVAALLGGVAADVLAQERQHRRSPATVLRVVGGVVPLVMWLSYFGVLALFYDVGWSVEFWAGITVMSSLAGLGLGVLMTLQTPTDAFGVDPRMPSPAETLG